MRENETLSVLIYMCNRWQKSESQIIFDGELNDNPYSMGNYVWDKWVNMCENYHGSLCAITPFLLDIDTNSLNLIIDRACHFYNGRKNK